MNANEMMQTTTNAVKTIRLRGRDYTVERVEGEREIRYRLTGKRGGQFWTMRNHHRPERMFVNSMALSNRTLEGVWLTDKNGSLEIVCE